MSPKFKALIEVYKDFFRWALSAALAWFVEHGLEFILSYLSHKNIELPPETKLLLTAAFKYLDYWYHRYRKQVIESDKSLGIYPV